VRREEFDLAQINEEHSIPSIIDGKMLSGACFSDIDLDRIKGNETPSDEYYFLPCKEN